MIMGEGVRYDMIVSNKNPCHGDEMRHFSNPSPFSLERTIKFLEKEEKPFFIFCAPTHGHDIDSTCLFVMRKHVSRGRTLFYLIVERAAKRERLSSPLPLQIEIQRETFVWAEPGDSPVGPVV